MFAIGLLVILAAVHIGFAIRDRPVVLWQNGQIPSGYKPVKTPPRYIAEGEVLISILERSGKVEYIIAVKQ